MPPLTDIVFSVDDLGAWGAGGAARQPTSANSIGYGGQALKVEYTASLNHAMLTSTTLTGGTAFSLDAAVIDGGVFGELYQPPFNIFGSITPSSLGGLVVEGLYVDTTGFPGTDGLTFILTGAAAQSIFTTLTVNGVDFTSASAAYTAGASTTWFWPGSHPFAGTGTYAGNFA